METCDLCGAEFGGRTSCLRCATVHGQLKIEPDGAVFFGEWLEDVIATRIRAFIEAGHMNEAVDARVGEAIDRHKSYYYHNRRPGC